MRRRLTLTLVVLNILLAAALAAGPALTQIIPMGFFDCCEGSGPSAICCHDCCWFVRTCDHDDDCRKIEMESVRN